MKAKDTLLSNKTITQNPILVRRAWFWHVASEDEGDFDQTWQEAL